MTTNPELSTLIAGARAVLFDFDGPLCDVFAGMPADEVARQLEQVMGERVDSDDPLQVLRESVRFGPTVVRAVEDALIAAEVAAVSCSRQTPGGVEAIRSCLATDRLVAVVSNNSSDAVAAFLRAVGLASVPVVGRPYASPERMKPNPWPLVSALELLRADCRDAVFVGDSFTDLEASETVGVPCLAYANKPWKLEAFRAMNVLVVTSMGDISCAIGEQSRGWA